MSYPAQQASPENVQVNMAMQQSQMTMPQGVVVPQGLPPGLAYLGNLDEVRIHQHLDVLEGIYACR
jgi:hypothetical protein